MIILNISATSPIFFNSKFGMAKTGFIGANASGHHGKNDES